MSPSQINFSSKRGKIAITLLIVIFLIIPIVFLATSQLYGTLDIVVAPSDSTVTINGKPGRVGRNYLLAGQYTISISHDNFTEQTQSMSIDGGENKTIDIALPANNIGNEQLANNSSESTKYDDVFGNERDQHIDQLAEAHPITTALPFDSTSFIIDYNIGENEGLVVTIDAFSGDHNDAIKKIFDLGYDPGDYRIEFRNYQNPFKGTGDAK